jgi:LysM repeat protein
MFLLAGCFQQAGQALQQQPNLTMEPLTVPSSTPSVSNPTSSSNGELATATPGFALTIISPTRDFQTTPTSLPSGQEITPDTSGGSTLDATPQQFVTPISPLGPITATPTALAGATTLPLATSSGLVTPTALSQTSSSLDSCTHTVQSGENLYRIALQYEISLSDLRNANPEVSGDLIQPGQILKIPDCTPNGNSSSGTTNVPTSPPPTVASSSNSASGGGTVYIVQPGDTLFTIAQRYGVTVKAIQDANNLSNPNRLSVGQELTIPAPSS